MKNILLALILFSVSALMFLECSDEPGSVGLGVLPRNDTLRVDSTSLYATSDTTFLLRASGSPTRLMVGSYQDLRARLLLQYSGFSNVPATAILDSAILSFNVDYRFKDSTGIFGFEVHKMLRSWHELTFTWDTSNYPNTYRSTPDTNILRIIGINDTILRVRIDRLAQEWIASGVNAPEGLILIPDTLTTNLILGMRNEFSTLAPSLTISYHHPADTTVNLVLTPIQSSYVANGSPPSTPQLRDIQAGVVYRELLKFDSLSGTLPARVSILHATLDIATDRTSSLLTSGSTDSLLVYMTTNQVSPYKSLAYSTLCVPAFVGSQKVYRADIRNIVQQWVTVSQNYGLIIRTYNETTTLDRVALYGAGASGAVRPKLSIVYSILP